MGLNIIYKTKQRVISKEKLKQIVNKLVSIIFKNEKNRLELNFVFVDNKYIRQVNRQFCKKNSLTDVLCFKYDEHTADIIISIPQVIKNAKLYNNSTLYELLFVIVHGLLHFKGMEDKTKKERKEMLSLGTKILSKLSKEIKI